MFYQRDFTMGVLIDFRTNVLPFIEKHQFAVPCLVGEQVCGWVIKDRA